MQHLDDTKVTRGACMILSHVEDLNTVGKKKTKYGNNEDNTIPSSTHVATFDGPHEQI